jgi:hypothetical protein
MTAVIFHKPTFLAAAAAASVALIGAPAGPAIGGSFGHSSGGGAHMGMPSGGFRGAGPGLHGSSPRGGPPFGAPSFHGSSPRVGAPPGATRPVLSGPGRNPGASPRTGAPFDASRPERRGPERDREHFSGRNFDHFSPTERARWAGGGWRHGWRHGRFGWWWLVGDDWFLYDAPSYPYPTYVGEDDDYSYDPSAVGDYYCPNPPGYYPDVAECDVEWELVPAQ